MGAYDIGGGNGKGADANANSAKRLERKYAVAARESRKAAKKNCTGGNDRKPLNALFRSLVATEAGADAIDARL